MSAIYEWLMLGGGPGDQFDRHVFACVFAAAAVDPDRPLSEAIGLEGIDLRAVVADYFPHAEWLLADRPLAPAKLGESEVRLRAALAHFADPGDAVARRLVSVLARRAQLGSPLWRALGLFGPSELSELLWRHFRPLARADRNWMEAAA